MLMNRLSTYNLEFAMTPKNGAKFLKLEHDRAYSWVHDLLPVKFTNYTKMGMIIPFGHVYVSHCFSDLLFRSMTGSLFTMTWAITALDIQSFLHNKLSFLKKKSLFWMTWVVISICRTSLELSFQMFQG